MAVSRVARLSFWLWHAPSDASYPNSSSPVTANPRVSPTGSLCGHVQVIHDALLDSYGKIVHGLYTPPDCAEHGHIQSVVLRVHGAVVGRQFDRYGGLWVGGVEVLRTTTPEPTPAGIYWMVERDVSDYAALFAESQSVSLAIPNVVNSIYTGVFHLNVSFEIRTSPSRLEPPAVLPLLSVPALQTQPFSAMALTSGWFNVSLPLPPKPTERLLLDVFASGHGCEEFEAGFDCGGPLRRLRLLVDGRDAGLMYPSPVVYTGGIFPTLWRPLTGIDSFDIPPYRFELTPFLPLLLRPGNHTLSIKVDSEDAHGTWYLDPVLLCVPGPQGVVGGQLHKAKLDGTGITLHNVSSTTVVAQDRAELQVRAQLALADGSSRVVEVFGRFSADAIVTTKGSGGPTQPPPQREVQGQSQGSIAVSGLSEGDVVSTFRFPYYINLSQSENGSASSVRASVNFSKVGSLELNTIGGSWGRSVQSDTAYVTDSTGAVVLEEDTASESFSILDETGGCYDRHLAACNGSLTINEGIEFGCTGVAASSDRVSSPSLPLLPPTAPLAAPLAAPLLV